MALAGDTLDELVKPNLRAEWTNSKIEWFPRSDTPENAAYDKRTPGNWFKLIVAGNTVAYTVTCTYNIDVKQIYGKL